MIQCVAAEDCVEKRPELPFADPTTMECASCGVQACRRCRRQLHCDECFPEFVLNAAGTTCVLSLDTQPWIHYTLYAVGFLLVVLVCIMCFWSLVKGFPEHSAANQEALRRARQHRHLVKVQEWCLEGKLTRLRRRYPLLFDLHNNDILGVGVGLFYNSLCFLMLVAVITFLVTKWVYARSAVSQILSRRESDERSLPLLDNLVPMVMWNISMSPALVLSPLSSCGLSDTLNIEEALGQFSKDNFLTLFVLYVVLFLMSLAYACFQVRFSKRYDKKNCTMSDFAVFLDGLPPDVVDEEVLKKWFEAEVVDSLGETIQVVGVSICYEYAPVADRVEEALGRLLERREVDLGLLDWELTSAAVQGKTPEEDAAELRKMAAMWFDPASEERLRSCGKAFVVFDTVGERDRVAQHFEHGEGTMIFQHFAAEHVVHVSAEKEDPVSVYWVHMGVDHSSRVKRISFAFFKVVVFIAAAQWFVWIPFASTCIWPYAALGTHARGIVFALAGTLLGNVNMVLCILIFNTAFGLGFARKHGLDTFIFWCNTVLTFANTCINIINMVLRVQASRNQSRDDEDSTPSGCVLNISNFTEFTRQLGFAKGIYELISPGMFFIGYLLGPIMGGVIPYVWNTLLMKMIYVWGCWPRPLLRIFKLFLPWAPKSLDHYPARNAEKGLEPPEVGLGWDYQAIIVFPSICFLQLYFISPYVNKTFCDLLLWSLFYYGYCRYMHLRFNKAAYFSSDSINTHVTMAWGLPLSVLAGVVAAWALRAGHLGGYENCPRAVISSSFFCSLALWLSAYLGFVRPFSKRDLIVNDRPWQTFDAVKKHNLPTWFNCNPVYMLKCEFFYECAPHHTMFTHYYSMHDHGQLKQTMKSMVIPYEVGKERLFYPAPVQEALMDAQYGALEFETYFEFFLAAFCRQSVRKVLPLVGSTNSDSELDDYTATNSDEDRVLEQLTGKEMRGGSYIKQLTGE